MKLIREKKKVDKKINRGESDKYIGENLFLMNK